MHRFHHYACKTVCKLFEAQKCSDCSDAVTHMIRKMKTEIEGKKTNAMIKRFLFHIPERVDDISSARSSMVPNAKWLMEILCSRFGAFRLVINKFRQTEIQKHTAENRLQFPFAFGVV